MMAHLLLVEGKDEKELFRHLLSTHPLQGVLEVRDCGGIRQFDEKLGIVMRQPSFRSIRSITVVRDAEESADAAFASVQKSLKDADLPVPDSPNEWSANTPFVQICIVPENLPAGCTENLFLQAHRSTQAPLHYCLDALRTCWTTNQLNSARWAKIYTAVILRAIPGAFASELGQAIQKAEFSPLLNQEPLLQLTRILHRIQAKSHA